MNGFEVAQGVAALINGAGLVLDANAEAKLAPIVKSENLPDDPTIATHVLFGGKTTERMAKRVRARVFTIYVSCYRRVGSDLDKASEFFDLVDEIDDLLATSEISGVRRLDVFQQNDVPYVMEHMRDNGIATAVLEATYELRINDAA